MSVSKWKKYPSYKESVERKSMQIPSHWEMIPNRHLMKLRNQEVGEDWSSTDLLSLTLRGIIPRDIESGVGKYPASFENYQIVEKDDLVFCLFDVPETPRTIGISNQRGMITGAYDVLSCLDGVSPHFIHDYYLALDFIKGLEPYYTGLRNVVRTDAFNQMKTPIPPLHEQLKITKFIQNIDFLTTSLQRILEEKIELLEQKRSTILAQAVTKGLDPDVPMRDSGIELIGKIPEHWGIKRMKQVTDEVTAGPFGSSLTKAMYVKSGYRVYGQEQVIADDFSIGNYYISDQKFVEMQRYQVKEDDILVSAIGTIGRVSVVPYGVEEGIFNPRLVRYTVNKQIIQPYFLKHLLLSDCSQTYFDLSAGGTTMRVLNLQIIGENPLPIPPINEQNEITKYIEEKTELIENCRGKIASKIERLKEYRTTLIYAAVTGKIDVRSL